MKTKRFLPQGNFDKPFLKRFCPRCGKEKGEFIKGFCRECFLEEKKIIELQEKAGIIYCKKCGRIHLKNVWAEATEKALKEAIESKVKVRELVKPKTEIEILREEEKKAAARIKVSGEIEGKEVEVQKEAEIEKKIDVCDECMKASSDFFEATLQVRFEGAKEKKARARKVLQEIDELLAVEQKKDMLAKYTKMEELSNGFDLFIGSKQAAKNAAEGIARKHKGKVIFSSSVVGMTKSGKTKKRYTYCARI